ncbi:MAG: hypothetical protein HYT19_01760 [Candidatus Nealsonbacteria bacterium]|nr:hypothetical protein [Candidatus Nealsonbacteria bacterium]
MPKKKSPDKAASKKSAPADSELIMFYGTECHFCHEMEPYVQKLEKELKVKIERIEVWHNAKNAAFMQQFDKGFCGGVPFFYNKKTGKWICGFASYENLKAWAVGK